jgi:HlyD family secretion protein
MQAKSSHGSTRRSTTRNRGRRGGSVRGRGGLLGFKTAVEDAHAKLARAETLAANHLIPPADLDAARIAMDEANAGAWRRRDGRHARAAVDQAAVNVEHAVIRSPIDGIVIDREVDVGQTLAASIQSPVLFRIAADLKKMQVQVNIDESDVGGLTPAEPATFEVESYPDETFQGLVSQLRLQPVAEQTATATAASDAVVVECCGHGGQLHSDHRRRKPG